MSQTRLDKWKTPVSLGLGFITNDRANAGRIHALRDELLESRGQDKEPEEPFTINRLIRSCRELIFDVRDDKPLFHAVSYALNGDTLDIEISLLFEIMSSPSDGESEDDEIRSTLAIAVMEEVPVYPNTPELAPVLASYHRRMLTDGFTAPDGKGGRMRLKLAKRPTVEFIDPKFLTRIDCTSPIYPAEIEIIKRVLIDELGRLGRAEQVLASLDLAIDDLEGELSPDIRNENNIQRSLTRNPIIFGVDYTRIIPKHRLGSEFEMDYAAERLSGYYDLVEIESSSLSLYNKNGNPSSHLIHAEQQVLDWIAWIEKHNEYARSGLPGIAAPVGYVVIGRRNSLTTDNAERLKRRNISWRGQMLIMTYDDLLDRAKNLKSHLEAIRDSSSASLV